MKLPCTHGIAAAAVAGRLGQNMMQWLAESVHPGYHLVRYAAVLAQATVQLVDTTSLAPDGQTLPAPPSPVGGARGARPTQRKKGRLEARVHGAVQVGVAAKKYKCGKCGGVGHNRQNCMGLVVE
jgi:hypothetical protein